MPSPDPAQTRRRLQRAEQVSGYAIKSWRYLRLAMIALVVGLASSVLFEWGKGGRSCFQSSISAYYYTPVRAVFVGALLAIGVCLVCLRGNRDLEDLALNLAGVSAAVVALVPTPNVGLCTSAPAERDTVAHNVANNVFALLIVGAVGLLVVLGLALRDRLHHKPWPSSQVLAGYGVLVALE